MSKSLPEQEENAHAGFWKISNSTYANGKSPKVENLQKISDYLCSYLLIFFDIIY